MRRAPSCSRRTEAKVEHVVTQSPKHWVRKAYKEMKWPSLPLDVVSTWKGLARGHDFLLGGPLLHGLDTALDPLNYVSMCKDVPHDFGRRGAHVNNRWVWCEKDASETQSPSRTRTNKACAIRWMRWLRRPRPSVTAL